LNKEQVGHGWGNNILMQRDGALIKIRPCGSTDRLGVSHASMFWMLQELRGTTPSVLFLR